MARLSNFVLFIGFISTFFYSSHVQCSFLPKKPTPTPKQQPNSPVSSPPKGPMGMLNKTQGTRPVPQGLPIPKQNPNIPRNVPPQQGGPMGLLGKAQGTGLVPQGLPIPGQNPNTPGSPPQQGGPMGLLSKAQGTGLVPQGLPIPGQQPLGTAEGAGFLLPGQSPQPGVPNSIGPLSTTPPLLSPSPTLNTVSPGGQSLQPSQMSASAEGPDFPIKHVKCFSALHCNNFEDFRDKCIPKQFDQQDVDIPEETQKQIASSMLRDALAQGKIAKKSTRQIPFNYPHLIFGGENAGCLKTAIDEADREHKRDPNNPSEYFVFLEAAGFFNPAGTSSGIPGPGSNPVLAQSPQNASQFPPNPQIGYGQSSNGPSALSQAQTGMATAQTGLGLLGSLGIKNPFGKKPAVPSEAVPPRSPQLLAVPPENSAPGLTLAMPVAGESAPPLTIRNEQQGTLNQPLLNAQRLPLTAGNEQQGTLNQPALNAQGLPLTTGNEQQGTLNQPALLNAQGLPLTTGNEQQGTLNQPTLSNTQGLSPTVGNEQQGSSTVNAQDGPSVSFQTPSLGSVPPLNQAVVNNMPADSGSSIQSPSVSSNTDQEASKSSSNESPQKGRKKQRIHKKEDLERDIIEEEEDAEDEPSSPRKKLSSRHEKSHQSHSGKISGHLPPPPPGFRDEGE